MGNGVCVAVVQQNMMSLQMGLLSAATQMPSINLSSWTTCLNFVIPKIQPDKLLINFAHTIRVICNQMEVKLFKKKMGPAIFY